MSSTGTSASKRQERFHGAFTGGFSAGFYNTVGSAEGWAPSSFTSSRDKRAAPREQRPEDFMDDDDGLLTEQLQAKPEFDTLGSTAGEVARKHAEREAAGGAIPGPAPSELIMPVGDPMGKKLLRTMGWREGQGVGIRVRRGRKRPISGGHDSPDEDIPEQARAGLGKRARALVEEEGLTFAPRNTDVQSRTIEAKTGLHGVGHDPFKNAPEFSTSRGARGGSVGARSVYRIGDLAQQSGDGNGAGVGLWQGPTAASILDRGSSGFVLDDGEDDVYEAGVGREAYDNSLDAGGDNAAAEDSFSVTAKAWALGGGDAEEEPILASRRYARCPSDGRLPPAGFLVAQRRDASPKYWAPPLPPANFNPVFKFEEDVANPLRFPTGGRRNGPGLDAFTRAKLLGEPGRTTANNVPAGPPAIPVPSSQSPPDGSSALSFLSPAARKKLLDAANAGKTPPGSSQVNGAAALPPLGSAGIAAGRVVGPAGARKQESADQRQEGPQFSLANKFTSENTSSVQAQTEPLVPVGGVDPASRPAGLSFPTPIASGNSATSPSPAASAASMGGLDLGEKPVRSTFAWRPAPLLCKRLNVPVPKDDMAPMGGPHTGGASSASDQGLLGPLGKFVPDSSAVQPKVPLLKGMEKWHPLGVPREPEMSFHAGTVQDPPAPTERPPIDLFKSIFESESESDSEESGGSDGEDVPGKASGVGAPSVSLALPADGRGMAPPVSRDGARGHGMTKKDVPRLGYGSDSSEDAAAVGEIESHPSATDSLVTRRREKEHTGGEAAGNIPSEESESNKHARKGGRERDRTGGERRRSSSSRKRSDSKHKHKRKKDKSEKKHRKHYHKRKSRT